MESLSLLLRFKQNNEQEEDKRHISSRQVKETLFYITEDNYTTGLVCKQFNIQQKSVRSLEPLLGCVLCFGQEELDQTFCNTQTFNSSYKIIHFT